MGSYEPSEAEKALNSLNLDILTDKEILDYNDTRNNGAGPQPEICLKGWIDKGFYLSKEIYVRDKTGENIGIYCRALYCEWEGQEKPSIILEDYEGNEFKH